MRIPVGVVSVTLILFFLGCQNEPRKKTAPVLPADFYGTYQFTYVESLDGINCLFQFSAGKDEKGMFLPRGASISLDGREVSGDSVSIGEVYYETSIPVDRFSGKHVLALKDAKGKITTHTFTIEPVHFTSLIPKQIRRQNLELSFDQVEKGDRILASFIDTSFTSNDLHIDTTLNGNSLLVDRSRFRDLSNGLLMINILIERRLILNDLKGEMMIRFYYGKETELVD